jgi:DNA modification methylase
MPGATGKGKPKERKKRPTIIYRRKKRGTVYVGLCEDVLRSKTFRRKYLGKIKLIFTSPPFPLNKKKKYGNLQGDKYVKWLSEFGPLFAEYLAPNGSIVMEIGNSWEKGSPTQSILPYQALLGFLQTGKLKLCQEIIYHNPATLPTPAQWVTIERIRLKNSTSKLWWMATTDKPDADNRRILKPYSNSMKELLKRGTYNSGKRPSEHKVSKEGFLKKHPGAIRPNLFQFSNTGNVSKYQLFCNERKIGLHPARMPEKVAELFIEFLTKKNQIILDPFSGSNTTGAAADRLKRKWIAIEAKADYAASGVSWFSEKSADTLLRKQKRRKT